MKKRLVIFFIATVCVIGMVCLPAYMAAAIGAFGRYTGASHFVSVGTAIFVGVWTNLALLGFTANVCREIEENL